MNIFTDQVRTSFYMNSKHSMVTDMFGPRCTIEQSPYITNCHFNVAQDILAYINDIDQASVDFKFDRFYSFNQPNALSLADTGYAYIPAACEKKECHVHMVFHGCMQTIEFIGYDYIEFTGYNGVAEANDIIILYPQINAINETNPSGCWDFYGYTDTNGLELYSTQLGPQVSAMKSVLDQISEGTLEFTRADISGGELITTASECLTCG